jgi:hypothetical protein
MNNIRPLTNVSVFFIPLSEANVETEVHLLHTGWSGTADWEQAREWFEVAWTKAFSELEKYVNQ